MGVWKEGRGMVCKRAMKREVENEEGSDRVGATMVLTYQGGKLKRGERMKI